MRKFRKSGESIVFRPLSGDSLILTLVVIGGAVHEPMLDLVKLLGLLSDHQGKITIPGVCDTVAELTPDESALYDSIDFELENLKEVAGAPKLLYDTSTKDALMHMWRYPALSIHGIEGAHHTPGAKTVIPSKVIGKFSIRIVPNQEPAQVEQQVMRYLEESFASFGSPNSLKVVCEHGAKGFGGDSLLDDNSYTNPGP